MRTVSTNTGNHPRLLQGVVISDLHLFAHRSVGGDCFASVRDRLAGADVLVLNGDIFDFRWSTLPDVETTVAAALAWLRALSAEFPHAEVHYVLGNHDCPAFFHAGLDHLAGTFSGFHWHRHGVRIGSALFVHGDCTHRKMDRAGLQHYRKCWDNRRQHGAWRAHAYRAVDRLGVTWLTHKAWFPRRHTVRRLSHYLDRSYPTWRETARDCYFGHTHLPFSDYRCENVTFHNTGSGIRGMGFNPKLFTVSARRGESQDVDESPVSAT
ncbi:MAG TPA: metallophosphoesterase [Opitutaceae bacterium]|nr:metallophosphoesterase [Opitutaceae bacterium]